MIQILSAPAAMIARDIQLIILGFESIAKMCQSEISKSSPRIQPRPHDQHLATRSHHPAEIGGFALRQL